MSLSFLLDNIFLLFSFQLFCRTGRVISPLPHEPSRWELVVCEYAAIFTTVGKERGYSDRKKKRFLDEKHTQTHRNLTEMFRQSQMSFLIRTTSVALYCVFTYIYSHLMEKDICDCRNISVNFLCVYVCHSSRDLFIFLVRVSSFFSYFFFGLYKLDLCLFHLTHVYREPWSMEHSE